MTDGVWVGTVTTAGDVTTVVNESGSVWGGPAHLVEEASIGVEAGDEHYMFGRIASMWATDDLIYVLDSQVPVLRVFDMDGHWVRDIGRAGQGPGGPSGQPGGLGRPTVRARRSLWLLRVEDGAGTPMVKRYRLMAPETENR